MGVEEGAHAFNWKQGAEGADGLLSGGWPVLHRGLQKAGSEDSNKKEIKKKTAGCGARTAVLPVDQALHGGGWGHCGRVGAGGGWAGAGEGAQGCGRLPCGRGVESD